jgi:hypothetical protein
MRGAGHRGPKGGRNDGPKPKVKSTSCYGRGESLCERLKAASKTEGEGRLVLARTRQRPSGRPEACFPLGHNFLECFEVRLDYPAGPNEAIQAGAILDS